MNLYEFEGKRLFQKHGIAIPKGVVVRRGEDVAHVYNSIGVKDVVVKAQVLSGKRGENNGIRFCSNGRDVETAVNDLFEAWGRPLPNPPLQGEGGVRSAVALSSQYVASVLIEEKLDIAEEHYISITYDTNAKQPVMIYSVQGGMNIEDVDRLQIADFRLQISDTNLPNNILTVETRFIASSLWHCFLQEDARVVEINPLVKTKDGRWIAADAKVAIDDDAFFRHEEWAPLEPRTMMGRPPTDREIVVKKIDEGEKYYQGTAGKYIEMDGDIGLILNGGGASIANMDALVNAGLKAANYTEYSGNPPREKVYQLAKVVLSKPGLKGLWMCGVVANFTNIKETFMGIVDALDEIKPTYPIVVRRDGTESAEGFAVLEECAKRNNLNIKMFKKETGMSETAKVLASMIH